MTPLHLHTMPSPVGTLTLVGSDAGLRAVLWQEDTPGRAGLDELPAAGRHAVLDEARRQLTDWFEGRTQDFDVPLDLHGTDFQLDVWRALLEIPFAETVTYGELAARLGRPTGARAVGAAVGRNPVSIIVPCHRVVGADGSLTGFAGGMPAKRWLLHHEGDRAAPRLV